MMMMGKMNTNQSLHRIASDARKGLVVLELIQSSVIVAMLNHLSAWLLQSGTQLVLKATQHNMTTYNYSSRT